MTLESADYGAQLKGLAERLSRVPQVRRLDTPEHIEAEALAHALLDLNESFRAYTNEHLPRLLSASEDAHNTYEVLLDIGEELRHITYHLKDAGFFRYVSESGDVDTSR